MDKDNNFKKAMKAGIITIISNVLLTAFKLVAGIIGNSTAMIADAIHSFSDLYTTIIVLIGIKLADKKADKEHPYGHERFECVAAIILSAVLIFIGGGIGWAGIQQIVSGAHGDGGYPGIIALVAAVTTLVVQLIMFLYKRMIARRIDSGALMADAWHHLSDALSSVGAFIGVLGARLGFSILDPIAAIVICLVIFKVAIDIFRDATSKMTDKACDDITETQMRNLILQQNDVIGIDLLRTRLFGEKIYMEVEIAVDGSMSVFDAHGIAHAVHDALEETFPKVKHCTVHVNPG